MVLSKYNIYMYVLNSNLPYFLIQTNNAYELFAIDIKVNQTEYFRVYYATDIYHNVMENKLYTKSSTQVINKRN